MMAPREVSVERVKEDKKRELRLLLFRARLLLALHEQEAHCQKDVRSTVRQEHDKGERARLSSSPGHNTTGILSNSLHTLELEDDSTDSHPQEQQHEEEDEEKSVVFRAMPLPLLRWPPPTRQQRLDSLEKRSRRQKQGQADHVENRSWLCGTRIVAAVRRGADDTGDAKDDENRNCLPSGFRSTASWSSSLTATGDRSERGSSPSTYAASHASSDDVYIHELARKCGSVGTNSSSVKHHSRFPMSATFCGALSSNPMRTNAPGAVAGVNSSESTALTTNMEFDRIGRGEAAPYTSYLFSPAVCILDLGLLSTSTKFNAAEKRENITTVADGHRNSTSGACGVRGDGRKSELKHGVAGGGGGGGNFREAVGPLQNGCTRVCFSPDGSCYIIGTQKGDLWFIPVDTQSTVVANISVPVPAAASSVEPLLLQGHSGAVTDVAFNNVGTFFASAGVDACVILWNRRTRLKMRRINTEGNVPATVGFMPKNNNYILVSLPQCHLLRLYNTSTGLPVTRKGPVIRVEATAVAIDRCADPFLFVGDVNGIITMWRFRAGGSDIRDGSGGSSSRGDGGILSSLAMGERERGEGEEDGVARRTEGPKPSLLSLPLSHSAEPGCAASAVARVKEHHGSRQRARSTIAEGQPHFEKVGELVVAKGVPVRTVVVSNMNHQQLHSLLRAKRIGRWAPEKNTIKRWAVAALSGVRQRDEYFTVSANAENAISALSACAVMLLVSLPCDRLVMLCVQPCGPAPREYKLVPMLVIDRACRIRHMSAGTTAFCVDNTRCPTVSCTCEEGFVHIIACTAARPSPVRSGEGTEKAPAPATLHWTAMATLPVPCGGIPCGLAWSPDMRHLVVVTEEGVLYHWQRVHLLHAGRNTQRNNIKDRDDDDDDNSSPGPQALDEVDEWRMYFHREKERQLRRYREEKRGARRGGEGGGSLSASDTGWRGSGTPTNQSWEVGSH